MVASGLVEWKERAMSRPARRIPPVERISTDGLWAAYDFVPALGWGTYPERGVRGKNILVWEEDRRVGNEHPMMSRLSTSSLEALVTVGRNLGMG